MNVVTKIAGRAALLAVLAMPAAGCVAAAAAAGAAGAIAYTDRGAKGVVNATVPKAIDDTRAVFRDLGITIESDPGASAENDVTVVGRRGEMRITVEIERESASTSEVEVFAREGTLDWDRSLSRDILARINARS